jgi:hypothetical protein
VPGRERSTLETLRDAVGALRQRAPVRKATLVVVGILLVAGVVGLWRLGFAAIAAIPPVALLFLVWATSRITGWTWVDVSRRWFAAPLGLGSALLPLVVPVLVIATYAARVLDWQVQVGIGVLLAVVLGIALVNERDGAQATFDAVLPWRGGAQWPVLAWVGASLGVTAVVVLAVVSSSRGVYRFGGFSAVLELAGLVLLATAFVFRFASFRDDVRARLSVHVLALVVFAAAIVLWGHDSSSTDFATANRSDAREEAVLLSVLIAGFVAYSTVEGFRRVRGHVTGTAPTWVAHARRIGFLLALLSSLALVGAFGTALRDARGEPPSERFSSALPAREPTSMDDAELASTFLPTLRFHGDEQWWPSRVDRFVAMSTLYYLQRRVRPARALEPAWTRCLDSTAWDCRLLTCTLGDGECADALALRDGERPFVYARVVRIDRESTKEAHAGFVSGPRVDGKRVEIVVQYWLFYGHNRWIAFSPLGYLEQEHEGDWEAVVVGLARDRPLFVAYSAHCGGTWERWSEIETLARPGEAGARATHPLVAVARGSHANYLHAWSGRPPTGRAAGGSSRARRPGRSRTRRTSATSPRSPRLDGPSTSSSARTR